MFLHQPEGNPPNARPLTAYLSAIPEGREGIAITLKFMRQLTNIYKKVPAIRQQALDLISDLDSKNYVGEIKRIHRFVRDEIRYVRDITNVETIITPDRLLQIRMGDCDDKVLLLNTLLESIGVPTRSVAIAFKPGEFEHVLSEAKIGDRWFALETTEPVEVGWYPNRVVERLVMYN